jgi:hypothetical protein
VIYSYAPGRGGKYVDTLLKGFSGILQVDGYDGYNILTRPGRAAAGGGSSKLKRADAGSIGGGPVVLAYCWAHLRRYFYEIAAKGPAPEAPLFS